MLTDKKMKKNIQLRPKQWSIHCLGPYIPSLVVVVVVVVTYQGLEMQMRLEPCSGVGTGDSVW